jgi:CRP-like cAMP-binding protein
MPAKEIDVLKKVFAQLDAEAIEEVRKNSRIVDYEADYRLCKQDAEEDTFYIIVEGEANVFKTFEDQRKLLATKKAGEFFGEMALILNEPRSADVIAAGSIRVIEIDRAVFDRLIASNARVVWEFTQLTLRQFKRHQDMSLTRNDVIRHKVFLSYSSEDREFAVQLANDLSDQGYHVWVDHVEIPPGSDWDAEVEKGLRACTLMLLIVTPNSLDSKNVADECHFYLEENKPIVPIILKSADLSFRLRRKQHIDFSNRDEYSVSLSRLVAALQKIRLDESDV